jgi:acetate---CoA ligase (ADP-forming)
MTDAVASVTLESHPLSRLFNPRGVAVLGASETPGKYGYLLLKTLIEGRYPGAIYPVNPRGGALLGHRFLESLEQADGPVDVALVVRPAPDVLPAIREVSRRGVPFAIVYAAGFSEQGEEGRRLERAVVEAARAQGTRIVGPNGMNIYSAPARLNLSAIVPFPTGDLGFLSASGNLGYALAHEASRKIGVGFSRFVSVGNQADLALDDYLDFLRVDPHTRVVLIFLEGLVGGRERRFLDALAKTAAQKPVLILRGGRTEAGRTTARSHTGALAAQAEVTRAALEQSGAVLLDRADEALETALSFLESPLPRGSRVALVGEGGGHATILSDSVSEAGLTLEKLPEEMVRSVRGHLPPFAALVANPVELGGISEYDLRVYERVLEGVMGWRGCDQVILFGGYALYDEALCDFLSRRREETGKAVLLHDLYADEDRPAIRLVRSRRLPIFSSPELVARAAGALVRGSRASERARRALLAEAGTPVKLSAALLKTLQDARLRPERALREDEASSILESFGVAVLPSALARTSKDAVAAAATLGYPVVLKVDSASIVHKSDVGGVHLDLRGEDDVRRAFESVHALAPVAGVRLTPFRPGGVEVIVGARRDPQFGPLLLFGAGGILAELTRDVAIRLLPCAKEELAEMVLETRVGHLLQGGRRTPPADLAAVAQTLDAVARLILSLPEVADVEINPLRCGPEGAVALDARLLLGP